MPRICCQIHALTIRSAFFFTAAPFCLCVRSASINSFKLGNVPGIINLYSRILSPFQIINKFNSWLFLFFIQLPYKFIVFANQFCSDFYSMLHMACNDFTHRAKPFFFSGFWRLYYMVIALYIGFVLNLPPNQNGSHPILCICAFLLMPIFNTPSEDSSILCTIALHLSLPDIPLHTHHERKRTILRYLLSVHSETFQ